MIAAIIIAALFGALVGAALRGQRVVYLPSPSYAMPVRIVRERKPRDPAEYERPVIGPPDLATRWKAQNYHEAYEVEATQRARDVASGPSSFDEFDNHEEIVGGDNVVNLR